MRLPSAIRAASILRLKVSTVQPITAAKRTTPDPVKHLKLQTAPKLLNQVHTPMAPKPPDPQQPPPVPKMEPIKAAGFLDTLGRTIPMFADDALEIGTRLALRGGSTAAAVPVAMDKIHHIQDPNYQPDPRHVALQRGLTILNKLSSASSGQPGALMGYTPSKPMLQLDPTARSHFAFDAQGAASKQTMNSELPNIGTGDFPKMGGDGNAQGYGAVENRGGTTDSARQMVSQARSTPATGALTPGDAANSAFNRLRAYTKTETAPIDSPNPMNIA